MTAKRAVARVRTADVARIDVPKAAAQVHLMEAMEKAALRAKNVEAIEKAVLGKLEAQRDFAAGYRAQFHAGKPNSASAGRITADAYCSSFGFAERTVRRWAERLLEPESFATEMKERLQKVERIIEMAQAANYSSESVEWYTPRKYLDAAHIVLGEIDLDPASSPAANKHVNAKTFFTKKDDGLSRDWFGTVFLNPPYGKCETGSLAAAFCDKAVAEYAKGNVSAAIVLVNSVHSQKWQAPLFDFPLCLVHHRIEFMSGDGETNDNPTFQNMFVYMGPKPELFREFFEPFGYVVRKF